MDVPMPKPYKTRGTHFKGSFYREQLIAFKEKTKRRRHSSESVPTSFAAHVHFLLELFCQNTKSKFSSPHCRHTVGPNCNYPPKIRCQNSWNWRILEFLLSSACNDRKRNHVNLLKLHWKNLWNQIKWTYFRRVLAIWNKRRRHVSSLRFGG